jgi:hypothetical protein
MRPTTIGETFLVDLGQDIDAPAKDVTAAETYGDLTARIVFNTLTLPFIHLHFRCFSRFGPGWREDHQPSAGDGEFVLAPAVMALPKDHNLILAGFDPDPEDLDPARTTGSASGYVGLLYTGLVRLNPNLAVEPDLAERWTVNPDGTVYTFTLREGLKVTLMVLHSRFKM